MPTTYSPLRYPGGKTKLYKIIQPIIKSNVAKECIYVEPFAGGAGLALKLLFKGDVSQLILNDYDENISCFWNICLTQPHDLCDMVANCVPTLEVWDKQREIYKNPTQYSSLQRAFAILFLNRCNISGVISGGPIGGRAQNGKYQINARYNKNGLIEKIKRIGTVASRIQFYDLDATEFINSIVSSLAYDKTFINIDPPYVNKGYMLYKNAFTEKDHRALSQTITPLTFKWITTYDKCPLIQELYRDCKQETLSLTYSAGETKNGQELLIYGSHTMPAKEH